MKKILFVLILLFTFSIAFPFGKNKVNYYSYNWKVIETPHYRIYLTENDLFLSNEIIDTAEAIFEHHSKTFGFTPKKRIKLVIYRNQIDFQLNNIIPGWVGEGTGGFTEFTKQRVVQPYSGDFASFHHILSHEITHAFQGFTWGKGEFSTFTMREIAIPLWLIEGAAEYNSIGLDNEAEMMVSDGIINGYLPSLQQLSDLGSLNPRYYFFVYKEGQVFYDYIAKKYGEDIFEDLNHSIANLKVMDAVLSNTFDKNLTELNAEFFDYLRRKYQATISNMTTVELVAKRLIKKDTFFNMNPVYVSSNQVAFITDRKFYPAIALHEKGKKRLKLLVKGGFDEDYLEFHYGKRNNLSMSSNGEMCFVSRAGGNDVIHIYNFNTCRVEQIKLPFRIINSPEISRDGKRIVLSGLAGQRYNIYIYTRATKELKKITKDRFFDTQPRWLGDNKILFASNRRNGFESDNLDLFIYNLKTRTFEVTIDTGESDEYPTVSRDYTKVAFIKRSIHPTLMIYDVKSNKFWEEIVPIGGIFSPSYGEDDKLIFTLYNNHSYNIYEYEPKYTEQQTNLNIITNFAFADIHQFMPLHSITNKRYRTEMSIDNAIGAFTLNTSLGMAILGMFTMSDLLGNHRFRLLMDVVIEERENFLDYFNIDMTYFYLKQRYDIGMRVFNYSSYFYEFHTFQSFVNLGRQYSQSWGIVSFFSYPFTTFDRFQASVGVRGFRYLESIEKVGTNNIYHYSYENRDMIELSFVHDATMDSFTGPMDGIRFEITITKSFPIFTNSVSFERIVFDYRQYIMLYPGYSFAMRGVAGKMLGRDKDNFPFYLGGFNSIRGYDLWQFCGDTMFMLNFEFRFPLIMNMVLGFPVPIRMPVIWGVLFWDFGATWNSAEAHQFFTYDSDTNIIFTGLKSGVGVGMRLVLLPGIKLMLDFAVPYVGQGIAPAENWKTYFMIGVDF